jgi:hypothetical protein
MWHRTCHPNATFFKQLNTKMQCCKLALGLAIELATMWHFFIQLTA